MAKSVLFVKIPPTNSRKEDAMESLLQSLHLILPTNIPISLEIESSNQFLRFYIVTDSQFTGLVESQLYAQYPDAEIEETKDYLPEDKGNTAYLQIDFKNNSFLPIKTYEHTEENFLKVFSAVLSKTDPNEKVFFQLCLKRVGSKISERGMSALQYKMFGKKQALASGENPKPSKFDQDLYMGKLRLAYIAQDKRIAKIKLDVLANLLKNVEGSENKLEKREHFLPSNLEEMFHNRTFTNADYWTTSEIATLYHFPYEGSLISNVVESMSKRAPAPEILPTYGSFDPQEVSFIGETNYRNERKIFGIKRFDRRRHLYVVGKTGSGKSKLLELLLISDVQSGQGCCLIDPHGDLAEAIMHYIPQERIKDVVYVNPTDREFPVGFNPLEPVADYEVRQHLSTFFIAIFKKLFAASWNDRMEHLIRYITLALLETPDSNILGIPRMLSDTAYRQRVIKQIQDPVVKAFWTNEFSPSDGLLASEAIIPILNKVGQFIANPVVRNMVGQKKNILNFENFMNEGKIVIVNLSKGKLGDDNTALLGSMLITKIQQAALARAKMPEEKRRDFYFYIDEFQNFATDAFSSILSEARKYHLNLTVAHQYIAQLPEDVKATTFGNVASLIIFAVGADDANYLSKEFSPIFTADDMINLSAREMYIRMSVDGKVVRPFSARTLNVPDPTFNFTQEILASSRQLYSRNLADVEREIAEWSSAEISQTGQLSENGTTEDSFPEPII